MKPILTGDEYRRVDKAYEGDLIVAMDKAGYAVAMAAARAGAGYGKKVIVLAGPGNNGGDGYVAARYLHQRGANVEIHALALPKTPEAIDAAAKARAVGVRMLELGEVEPADVVIDALFGGGVRGGIPDEVRAWIETTTAPVVAVDFPTGLDPNTGEVADAAFRAVETVTFSTLKTSHVRGDGPDYCGRVTVADIGIHGGRPCLYLAEESDASRPPRSRTSHKWSAGAVLVVGGSTGIVGASVFAGRSALNFGAGSVVVASPNADLVHELAPQLPTFQMADAEARLDRFDVVVAGPGLAEADYDEARPILAKAKNVVLDAGGLTPEMLDVAREGDAQVVATPHVGELRRLTGGSAGQFATRAHARKKGITVLRKGNPTLITDGGTPILVDTGGPELASIGTGDVLAGMIGALWARGLEPLEAAVSGAYWHGVAGADLAKEQAVTADVLADRVAGYAW
ncbi:MAG: NAD(P)H-hydrate dehydratase [Acidimicrobiia bacterium]|nr:NAD(P)H-hydrate dehydratase [Acidimicrobiia bacterium]